VIRKSAVDTINAIVGSFVILFCCITLCNLLYLGVKIIIEMVR